jgi:hypothetical protein
LEIQQKTTGGVVFDQLCLRGHGVASAAMLVVSNPWGEKILAAMLVEWHSDKIGSLLIMTYGLYMQDYTIMIIR